MAGDLGKDYFILLIKAMKFIERADEYSKDQEKCRFAASDYDDALHALLQAELICPMDIEMIELRKCVLDRQKELPEKIKRLEEEQTKKLESEKKYSNLLNQSREFSKSGDYDRAVLALEVARGLNLGHKEVNELLIGCYGKKREADEKTRLEQERLSASLFFP